MKPSAVLLIDLENFYCSREDYCRNGPAPNYDRGRFGHDLERLLAFTRAMTADRTTNVELPFTVRRAYADFNVVRYLAGAPPQYYLRPLPEEILSQGVEPVQVFRLSRGGKNAADMRMAMDATSLLFSAQHVEHFVLVTGDADFIPVILELKRHGRTVSVIGVTGATSPKIQRFVDNFELFEDLLAAEEVEARSGEQTPAGDLLVHVAGAVQRLLARSQPLRFAAVKPLLSKELGHPFDPALFGCDTTGDFLRNHQAALGVVIRQGQHDSEVCLPGTVANGTNSTNGANGSRATPRPTPKTAAKAPEPHTAAHYRQLLATPQRSAADREGKVYGVPWSALVWACDAVVPLLAPPAGEPTHTTKLQPKLVTASDGTAIPDIVKHVRLFYPTLRAGLPVQGADGVYALPEGTTGELIRRSVLSYVASVVRCRLTESGCAGDIRPDQLAAVFDPGAALDEATAEFASVLAEPAPAPIPAPLLKPAPKPAPAAEDYHTAAGYVKLLKGGGPKGSETEAFKVLPVPWPSVERICADTFALLSPAAGGVPLPREQLTTRLLDAGKELFVEKYDQHVRRVIGILRLAGDLTEENGALALAADVTDGQNLRSRALAFLLQLLQLRLEERDVFDPIRTHVFVAALEAGPFTDQLVEEVAPAVEWLYRPIEEEPPAPVPLAEPVAEAPPEPAVAVPTEEPLATASYEPPPAEEPPAEPDVAPPEPATADALDLQPKAVDSAADSAVIDLTPPLVAPERVPVSPEPVSDPLAFDGALPEDDTERNPVPPEAPHEEPATPAPPEPILVAESLPSAPSEPAEEEEAEVDLGSLTSEAIAEAAAETTASGRLVVGAKRAASPPLKVAPPEPDSDSDGDVALIPDTYSPGDSPTEVFRTEDLLGSLPFAGLHAEGDLLFSGVDLTEHLFLRPKRPVVPPPAIPLFPTPEEVVREVDSMNSQPPPRRVPPPPPPPESA